MLYVRPFSIEHPALIDRYSDTMCMISVYYIITYLIGFYVHTPRVGNISFTN